MNIVDVVIQFLSLVFILGMVMSFKERKRKKEINFILMNKIYK